MLFLGAYDAIIRPENDAHLQRWVMTSPALKNTFLLFFMDRWDATVTSSYRGGLSFDMPLEKNGMSLRIVF
jgi:hypothetical protein